MNHLPTLSIIVWGRRGQSPHAAAWRSLAELDYPRDRLEIICLEAGAQPVPGLPPALAVRTLRSPQPGVGAVGNNLAARAASSR